MDRRRRRPGGRLISAPLSGTAPRVRVLAPFPRGAAHGGSLRASAMAERLEARGACVTWATVPAVHGTRGEKVDSLLHREPAIVRTHTVGAAPALARGADVVIASHSYMAPLLAEAGPHAVRMVDFHNLEWRVLADTGRAEGGLHGRYLGVQARLMERFERRVLRSGVTVALPTADEHAWAAAHGAPDALLVPNVLTDEAVAEAERAATLRDPRACDGPLVYVGTLTFPPNVRALLAFLETAWPAVRAADPHAELLVAGRAAPDVAAAVDAHPGVRSLGFVDDLPALLAGAGAAVLPFGGRGGSSLRCLQYALARVPVVASAAAVRGLPFRMGLIAETPTEWAAAVAACRNGQAGVDGAQEGARELQEDEGPWDALWEALALRTAVRV